MLKVIDALTKYTLMCDTYVFDYVSVVKLCCVKLYNMYLDLETKYAQKKSSLFLWMISCLLHGWLIQYLKGDFLLLRQAISIAKEMPIH
jgi:hypothetical protein